MGRVRFMDQQRVNLDGFAVEDPDVGLIAMRSPYDPEPGLVIDRGRVVAMDGVEEADFDALTNTSPPPASISPWPRRPWPTTTWLWPR